MQGFSNGCVGNLFERAGSFYMEMTALQLIRFRRPAMTAFTTELFLPGHRFRAATK